jgi:hypothetical protein
MSDKIQPAASQQPDADQPVGPTDDDNDTEGQSLWVGSSASYEMTKARNKDIERQAREHARQKEARAKGK